MRGEWLYLSGSFCSCGLISEATHNLWAGDVAVDIQFIEHLALLIHAIVASFSLNEVRKPDCIIFDPPIAERSSARRSWSACGPGLRYLCYNYRHISEAIIRDNKTEKNSGSDAEKDDLNLLKICIKA